MKKVRIGIAIVVVLALGIALTVIWPREEPKEIKIGAVLPLTGDAAQWGIPPMRGAQLATDQINAGGGVKAKKLVLYIEDTRCEPKEGVSAFNKLLTHEDLKIVLGAVGSSVTLAIAPIAEKRRVLLISPASTNPKITEAGDFIFRVIPSDSLRGKVFAEYLYNDLQTKSVGILYINNEGGVGNRNTFKTRFNELGGKVTIDESYEQGATDMRTQLAKIKSSDVEAVVVVSYPADTVLVMKQAKEIGLLKPLYFQTEAVEDPHVLKQAGNTAEGAVYILPAPAEGEKAEEFAESYGKKFGVKPELFAAEAYDIINLVADAINAQREDVVSSEQIRDYLYNVKNYPGASGAITFDKNGDVLKPMAIKKIIGGKPSIVKIK